MAMSISPYNSGSDRAKPIGSGVVLGLAGMSAYYLPVTKDRFVRNAYDVVKENAEADIEQLKNAAISASSGRLKPEQKLLLSQHGVAESFDAINNKITDLKRIITDNDYIKTIKQGFADNFADYKKSEALMDTVASKAFQKIRWTNFAWGAGIGLLLGMALGSGGSSAPQNPQV